MLSIRAALKTITLLDAALLVAQTPQRCARHASWRAPLEVYNV